jgi:formylmethanofuran dehydrogenase subunit E
MFVLLLIFVILVILLMYLVYIIFSPSKCTKCEKILIKGHIKRINTSPFCKKCYNEIMKQNQEE